MNSLQSKIVKQRERYSTAIEALQEIVENDDEIDAVQFMITYLKEKRRKATYIINHNHEINQIQAKGLQEDLNQL